MYRWRADGRACGSAVRESITMKVRHRLNQARWASRHFIETPLNGSTKILCAAYSLVSPQFSFLGLLAFNPFVDQGGHGCVALSRHRL